MVQMSTSEMNRPWLPWSCSKCDKYSPENTHRGKRDNINSSWWSCDRGGSVELRGCHFQHQYPASTTTRAEISWICCFRNTVRRCRRGRARGWRATRHGRWAKSKRNVLVGSPSHEQIEDAADQHNQHSYRDIWVWRVCAMVEGLPPPRTTKSNLHDRRESIIAHEGLIMGDVLDFEWPRCSTNDTVRHWRCDKATFRISNVYVYVLKRRVVHDGRSLGNPVISWFHGRPFIQRGDAEQRFIDITNQTEYTFMHRPFGLHCHSKSRPYKPLRARAFRLKSLLNGLANETINHVGNKKKWNISYFSGIFRWRPAQVFFFSFSCFLVFFSLTQRFALSIEKRLEPTEYSIFASGMTLALLVGFAFLMNTINRWNPSIMNMYIRTNC